MIKLIYRNITLVLDTEPDFVNRFIKWMSKNRMYSQNYFSEVNTFVFDSVASFTATLQKMLDEKF